MKRLSALGVLSLLLILGGAPAPRGVAAPGRVPAPRGGPTRGFTPSSHAYLWPIKPFDRQHPIRGGFGDPRTLAIDSPFGVTGPADDGMYSFHNGVDIVAWRGTPVYPVVSGRIVRAVPGEIVVDSGGGRSFQYGHLLGNVRVGQEVVAEQTILGWIQRPFGHVHFAEIDNDRDQNPLARGHLEPYRDRTKPRAIALDVESGTSHELTQGGRIGRWDRLAIEAVDAPAMPVPGPFAGLPQTPALVEWRLRRSGRTWGSWHVAADSRRAELPGWDFWDVYAAGTYQNFPVFNHRRYWRIAGRYLFRVKLAPGRLRPGAYKLEARVADIRGNHSTTRWPIEISGDA